MTTSSLPTPRPLKVVPVTKTKARQFVQEHHRHNEAPTEMQVSFAVGLEEAGELVAVATAGQPVARGLCDGVTLEVNRACVDGYHQNANSMLYGAIGRAARALGYERLVTYTLESESGASLRGAGFAPPIEIGARSWGDENKASQGRQRYDYTLWGERRQSQNVTKLRWEKRLVTHPVRAEAASSDAPDVQSGEGGPQPTLPLHSQEAA